MVDDGRCRSVSTINRRRWKPFRISPDRNRQSRRCNSWDTRHIGWDPQKLLLFDCATDTYWHFHCNGTQQSILLQFCCKRQHSYLAVILPPPPWRKSKLLDGRWRMMKGVNMTLLGFVLFHLLPRHAHVLVDLFGSARTRAPQHSPPTRPTRPSGPAESGGGFGDAELRRCADRLLGSPIAASEGRRCHAARCTDGAAKKRWSEADSELTNHFTTSLCYSSYSHSSFCSCRCNWRYYRSPMAFWSTCRPAKFWLRSPRGDSLGQPATWRRREMTEAREAQRKAVAELSTARDAQEKVLRISGIKTWRHLPTMFSTFWWFLATFWCIRLCPKALLGKGFLICFALLLLFFQCVQNNPQL